MAAGINAANQVVGFSDGQTVLWQNGAMINLGNGYASAINGSEQEVGVSGRFLDAFSWQDSKLSDLNVLLPPILAGN